MKPILLATLAALCAATAAFAQQAAEPPAAATKDQPKTSAQLDEIKKRLDEIVLKEVNFSNAELDTVVEFLSQESQKADPLGRGVNFLLRELRPNHVIRSLQLRNIKLMDVLKVVCDLTDMRFVIEPKAIVILPKDHIEHALMTSTFPVTPEILKRIKAASGDNDDDFSPDKIKKALEAFGISFPPASRVEYAPDIKRLILVNTDENREKLEKLIQDVANPQPVP
jgi:hypothetical protein